MNVVVVGAADDDSCDVLLCVDVEVGVDEAEVGQGLEDALPLAVVLGLDVRPHAPRLLCVTLLVALVTVLHLVEDRLYTPPTLQQLKHTLTPLTQIVQSHQNPNAFLPSAALFATRPHFNISNESPEDLQPPVGPWGDAVSRQRWKEQSHISLPTNNII